MFSKFTLIGLFDADGNTYVPNLVRIGPNYHPSLKQFALEFLVAKEKEANATREVKNIQNDVYPYRIIFKPDFWQIDNQKNPDCM